MAASYQMSLMSRMTTQQILPDPVDPVDPVDPTEPGDDTDLGDDTTDSTDEAESESGIFGMSYTLVGIIGAVVVLLLVTVFFVRGRGSKNDDWSMQENCLLYTSPIPRD